MENKLTINEYFEKGNFIIPNYQRGYKWGVPNDDGECAVTILMDNLINAYMDKLPEYYIQGVTVCKDDKSIILIDGQQRTTTFYLLLKYLKYDRLPEIRYDIRKESHEFLLSSEIKDCKIEYTGSNSLDENSQDIYYFKKTIKTIYDKNKAIVEREDHTFLNFILDKVKLFFIEINKEDATKVFSMMNGQKAIMKTDELIKASLLSKSSRKGNFQEAQFSIAEEWEINSLRNKYAREWDKWLYWWNKKSVKEFYGSQSNPMGLLLEYFYYLNSTDKNKIYNYKHFNELFFKDTSSAKSNYKAIRDLQKTFEDWYNDYNTFNYLGLIFKSDISKKEAILYLLKSNSLNEIKRYAKWALVGASHKQITKPNELNEDESTKENKAIDVLNNLKAKEVYGYFNQKALRQLLRRNVELDCQLKRKFDFNIYGEKSLEHIYPKSKATDLSFDVNSSYSVHCIGNLVLLDKKTNSSFNDALPEDKKEKYFDLRNVRWSLKLLHTVSVFTQKEWRENSIIKNQEAFLQEFENYYTIK
ncbi:DUF262 domain-containing protein [Flavobacterium aquiphilum]|uniref:DUF262 domain-containing protein n=1 Tax=Flavobacterium aquiphilum TaxID=3003261 RepID=UPI0024811ADD|nr:DUF262 domain-containing HNH endonuclease family protein [Flavobacterium aquiphilum]